MKHARLDYEVIQDVAQLGYDTTRPPTSIGEDEPVFILRARDVTAPSVVWAWALAQPPGELRDRLKAWAQEMADWQAAHANEVHYADVPPGMLRP